jgi:hypothetical protein
MDTNKQDYMNFMSAEFDRLDPAGKNLHQRRKLICIA